MRWLRCGILGAIAAITCGLIYLLLVLTVGWEAIRGDWAASQAQARVEQIYGQVREIAPAEATLTLQAEPQSGTYAWGLSDDSPRYAFVRSHQTYSTTTPFAEVLALYTQALEARGWITLDHPSNLIERVFQQSNDDLLIGFCALDQAKAPLGVTRYTLFVDFDEGVRGGDYCPDMWCYLARNYCEH